MDLKNIIQGLGLLASGVVIGYNAHIINFNIFEEIPKSNQTSSIIDEAYVSRLSEESEKALKKYDLYSPDNPNFLSVALRTHIAGTDKVPFFTPETVVRIRMGLPIDNIGFDSKTQINLSEPMTELEKMVSMMQELNLQNPKGINKGDYLDRLLSLTQNNLFIYDSRLGLMEESSPDLSESEKAIALLAVSKTVVSSKLRNFLDNMPTDMGNDGYMTFEDRYLKQLASAYREFVNIPFVSEGGENLEIGIKILDYMQNIIPANIKDKLELDTEIHSFYLRKMGFLFSKAQSEDPNNILEYVKNEIDNHPFYLKGGGIWKHK